MVGKNLVTRALTRRPGAPILRRSFGGVPERSKGSDCKSDGSAFGGSNPPPSTKRDGVLPALGASEEGVSDAAGVVQW